jgi:hypothetical protein
MLDPENPKESILDSIEWTEHELKEFLRDVISEKGTNKMTFDPYLINIDLRKIIIIAVLAVDGPQQPDVFGNINRRLEGTRVSMTYDNKSTETMMRLVFEANRFKLIQSDDGDGTRNT